nr:FAD/NAD(P)-binding protein [Streptococcus catagoni]
MGVSGLAVLLALAHKKQDQLDHMEIICFDDPDHLGRGIPFQEDDDSALINSPIDDISFDYRNMSDFMEWMAENHYDTSLNYVARSLYGQYMTEKAEQLMAQLPVTIVKHQVEAISYLPDKEQWQVKVEGKKDLSSFDEIHLACGDLPPIDPYQLEGDAAYISDPYPIKNLSKEDLSRANVAVIGTGLAAVDVIKWLLSHTKASIKAFSRSNYFPTVRILDGTPLHWQFFTEENLEKYLAQARKSFDLSTFEELLLGELSALGFADWETTTNDYLAAGTEGIKLSLEKAEQIYHLQQLASRVTNWLTDLWPLMTTSDRQAYQKKYGRAIVNLRNPMPDVSAKILLEAAKEDRLTTIEAVTDIITKDQGFLLKTKEGSDIAVHYVINATGYQLTPDNLHKAKPLIQSIIDQRLCQIDEQGGLTILPETAQVISPKHGLIPSLYAHGALINGVIYQNNSTITIQKMAERAVKD